LLQGRREQLVIASKYSLTMRAGDPNASGNHRKNMVRSVEQSLQRLQTEYLDLLYLHMWDSTTPVEEVLRAFDDLVRAGKILYVGLSDTPAWQASRMQAIADLRGWSPVVALQIPYNLTERTVERDLMPMALEIGMGVLPWSPLAGGVLSGKYDQRDLTPAAGPRPTRFDSRRSSVRAHSLSCRTICCRWRSASAPNRLRGWRRRAASTWDFRTRCWQGWQGASCLAMSKLPPGNGGSILG